MTFVEKQFKTAICEYYNTLYSKTTQLELKKQSNAFSWLR